MTHDVDIVMKKISHPDFQPSGSLQQLQLFFSSSKPRLTQPMDPEKIKVWTLFFLRNMWSQKV